VASVCDRIGNAPAAGRMPCLNTPLPGLRS